MTRSPGVGLVSTRHPARLVVISFGSFIWIGTALLAQPFAAAGDRGVGYVDALFTATSATCVTGLAVVDTGEAWSWFGEAVLVLLMQVGGIGIMTLASIVALVLGQRLGITARSLAGAETGVDRSEVRRVLLAVAVASLFAEAIIAAVLTLRLWMGEMGFGSALWNGIFLAVASFNNAGFALQSDNLVGFATDWLICVPVMAGIVAGGLGFPVFVEIVDKVSGRSRRPTWSLHLRVTLVVTAALLILGFVAFTVIEWSNPDTLGQFGPLDRLMNGAFMSVTTRTAGFNTFDIGAMREESWLITDLLMFIGAGSASTAGGIKVTTLAVLMLAGYAEAKGTDEVTLGRRRIPDRTVRQALAVTVISIGVVGGVATLLSALEPFGVEPILYETISAFGTVGLSTGITSSLGNPSKLVLTVMMFFGRVGPVTLAAAFALRIRTRLVTFPEERPLVG